MIAYPIGDPIGPHRVCANRPRIARVVSCQPLSTSKTNHDRNWFARANRHGWLAPLTGSL